MNPTASIDLSAHVYQKVRGQPGVTFTQLSAALPGFLVSDTVSADELVARSLADLIRARLVIAITNDNKAFDFDALLAQHDACEVVMSLMHNGFVEAKDGEEILSMDEFRRSEMPFYELRFYSSQTSAFIHSVFNLGQQSLTSVFGRPDRDKQWPDVFVLMPFAGEFQPLYLDHIIPVCERSGMSVGRADDFFHTTAVISDIWSAIHGAKVILADCTTKNPNVFYEIGIAHTLGKDTILLTQTMDDIPFDLRHLRVIVYNFTPRGARDLESKLEATIAMSTRK